MPAYPVSENKAQALQSRLSALQVLERDLEETFVGRSGVAIAHRPTGVRVKANTQRSQSLNRFLARRLLAEELEAQRLHKTRHELKAEQIREGKIKRKTRRPEPARKVLTVDERMKQFQLRALDESTGVSKAMARWLDQLSAERAESI